MKRTAILLAAGLAAVSTFNLNDGAYANATTPTNYVAEVVQSQDTMVLGKLYFVNLKEGEKPVMTALSLFGNRCGTEEFNSKPCSTEGIRSVFELMEWVEFHPQASAGFKVMVFAHKADQSFYLKKPLNDETPGYVLEQEIVKNPDEEENYHWGSFYLLSEDFPPGYYDFVFIHNNKVFATMLTRFYNEKEIELKSDAELEKLMSPSN